MGIGMRTPSMVERFIAEVLGTFLLVFIGGGAAAVTTLLLHGSAAITALQLHSRILNELLTPAGLVLIALAHGLALFIIVLIVGRVSGAHVNPSITFGLAVTGRFPWEEVPAYIIGQVLGAILGAVMTAITYGRLASTIGKLGAPSLSSGTSLLQGLVIEGVGAGILMLAIISTAIDTRSPAGWAGLTIGLALGAIIMVIGPATGAAVNPARAFGPDFVNIFFGVSTDWAAFVICYLIGPLIGATAAAFLYGYMSRLPRTRR
jgi:glycerol uptake facilitator protein